MSVTVLVDDREPAAVAAAVREHPDVEDVEVDRLLAGDLVVGDVGFERKTVRDYVDTQVGRSAPNLESQVERLEASYEHAYVLLEGDLPTDGSLTGSVPAAAVRGSMASVTARLGVPVLPCGSLAGLVDMAVRLGRKHTEDPSSRPLAPSAVPSRSEPTAKRMYACIDGVGPETAERLYEAFPSVEALVAAPSEELLAVDGVGPKRLDAIERALRGTEPARADGE